MKTRVTLALTLLFGSVLAAQTQFFPDKVFCESGETGTCERWYTPHLKAMKEPSLWEMSKSHSAETYRFLWLRTFHQPVSARLQVVSNGSGELVLKVLSGTGGYDPGHITRNQKSKVDKEAVSHFLELLKQMDFWSIPTEQESNEVGTDGAQWIIEGTKEGQYHVVDRWSPNDGAYRKAGLFLAITLGGLNPRYNDVY